MNRVVSTTVPCILIAVGLIMALAINYENQNFDLTMIGWIIAGIGALALIIAIASNVSSGRSHTRTAVRNDPATGDRITETDTRL